MILYDLAAYPMSPELAEELATLPPITGTTADEIKYQEALHSLVYSLVMTTAALEYYHRKAVRYRTLWRVRHDQVKAVGHHPLCICVVGHDTEEWPDLDAVQVDVPAPAASGVINVELVYQAAAPPIPAEDPWAS